jgi:hypothetical protein
MAFLSQPDSDGDAIPAADTTACIYRLVGSLDVNDQQ